LNTPIEDLTKTEYEKLQGQEISKALVEFGITNAPVNNSTEINQNQQQSRIVIAEKQVGESSTAAVVRTAKEIDGIPMVRQWVKTNEQYGNPFVVKGYDAAPGWKEVGSVNEAVSRFES
jgi:hypothetical protein